MTAASLHLLSLLLLPPVHALRDIRKRRHNSAQSTGQSSTSSSATSADIQKEISLRSGMKAKGEQLGPELELASQALVKIDLGMLQESLPLCQLHLGGAQTEWAVFSLLFGMLLGQPQQAVCGVCLKHLQRDSKTIPKICDSTRITSVK